MKSVTALLLSILLLQPAEAFIISSAVAIKPKKVYSFYFSETAILPDYTVKVSETAILPDLTLKIVHDPKEADLIFVDEYGDADMYVTKSLNAVGSNSIKVSETAILPDFTVKLSEDAILPDYTIYVLSTRFTKEEAAALFAVVLNEVEE